jgi:hypothetical protein
MVLFREHGIFENHCLQFMLVKLIRMDMAVKASGASQEERERAFREHFAGLSEEAYQRIIRKLKLVMDRANYWMRGYFAARDETARYLGGVPYDHISRIPARVQLAEARRANNWTAS